MASDFRLKEQLPELTERIVATYCAAGSIHHLGHCPLPNHDAVVSIVEDLKEVLFPGYRRREGLHLGNVEFYVGDLIDRLHDRLTTQIARALRHEARAHAPDECDEDFEALGQAKTLLFLDKIPALRETLALDVQAAYDGDPAVRTFDEIRRADLLVHQPYESFRTSFEASVRAAADDPDAGVSEPVAASDGRLPLRAVDEADRDARPIVRARRAEDVFDVRRGCAGYRRIGPAVVHRLDVRESPRRGYDERQDTQDLSGAR